jgi:hypothetical protein
MKIVLTVLYALAAVLAVLCGLFFALCPLLGLSRAFDMDWLRPSKIESKMASIFTRQKLLPIPGP